MIINGPELRKSSRKVRRLIREAHYKTIDTGSLQIVEIRDVDGSIKREERPIVQNVFVDAVWDDVDQEYTFWAVDTQSGDLVETHEFADEQAARFYVGGFK